MASLVEYSFNEGSGTTATDNSGNGNDGTLVGTPTWTSSGKYSGCITYDAVDDAVVFTSALGGASFFDGSHSYTVTCWINPDAGSLGGTSRQIWHTRATYDVGLEWDPANGIQLVWYNGTVHNATQLSTQAESAWNHYAGVLSTSANTFKMFKDAVAQNSTTPGTPSVTTGDHTIGGRRITSGGSVDKMWLGRIDNFRIYNTALTSSQIADDMNLAISTGAAAGGAAVRPRGLLLMGVGV